MKFFWIILLLTGCSWKTLAPTIGGGSGASVGALLGGPAGAFAGGTLGAGAGQIIKEVDENAEAKEAIQHLSHGDISALVTQQVQNHTGFDEIKTWVKNILMITGVILIIYLTIPLWLARKTATNCARTVAQKHLTRPPFPTNEKL